MFSHTEAFLNSLLLIAHFLHFVTLNFRVELDVSFCVWRSKRTQESIGLSREREMHLNIIHQTKRIYHPLYLVICGHFGERLTWQFVFPPKAQLRRLCPFSNRNVCRALISSTVPFTFGDALCFHRQSAGKILYKGAVLWCPLQMV